jgi:uncharacterized integral membrane protein
MSYPQVPDPSAKPYTGGKGSGLSAPMVIGLVILAALLIFIFQNTDSTEVNFLFFDFSAPLWLILLVVAVLAALFDGVVVRAFNKARGKETKKKS